MGMDMSPAELKMWISARFWKIDQVTSWVKNNFYLRSHHQQTGGTSAAASKPIITDSSGYIDTSFVNGTAHKELIADTVGAMFTGNTVAGISVTYQDSDNTIDLDVTADTADILDNAVNNSKLADMDSGRIKGRATSGSGNPEDLTATQVRTILNVADGANNYTHPNHTGDVTSVGDGATTIANDAVSNGKLANMDQATIKGRASGAGTGDPTDLTATQVRTILNVEDGADVTDATNVLAAGAVMTSGNQTIAGAKTFSDSVNVGGGVQIGGQLGVTGLITAGSGGINMGNSGGDTIKSFAQGLVIDDYFAVWSASIGDIGRTETVTVKVEYASASQETFFTQVSITCSRGGNDATYGVCFASAYWRRTSAGATLMGSGHTEFSSGVPSVTIGTTATGISVAFSSSDFTNTLNRNAVTVRTTGEQAASLSYTITIA